MDSFTGGSVMLVNISTNLNFEISGAPGGSVKCDPRLSRKYKYRSAQSEYERQ